MSKLSVKDVPVEVLRHCTVNVPSFKYMDGHVRNLLKSVMKMRDQTFAIGDDPFPTAAVNTFRGVFDKSLGTALYRAILTTLRENDLVEGSRTLYYREGAWTLGTIQ